MGGAALWAVLAVWSIVIAVLLRGEYVKAQRRFKETARDQERDATF